MVVLQLHFSVQPCKPPSSLQERDQSAFPHPRTNTKEACVTHHSSFAATNDPKGLAGYAGYLLSVFELERRKIEKTFHEGGIQLVLVVICMISVLVVYGWIGALVRWFSDPEHSQVSSMLPARLRGVEYSE